LLSSVVLCAALAGGCRCESGLGDRQARLDGAVAMARGFWSEVISGDLETAERRLASDAEIEAAARAWAEVMNEPLDDESIAAEVRRTRERLRERWRAYEEGEVDTGGMTAEMVRRAELVAINKMVMTPEVCFVQRLSLTDEGADAASVRVAGAVKVGQGAWKILWLP
jgi:hypothetical protein